MRIATYNVNGINGRLSVLTRWLEEEQPDVACLQELRAPHEKFPLREIEALGDQWWPLAMARELDDAILMLRTNQAELGLD